jgi:hypothetical protein
LSGKELHSQSRETVFNVYNYMKEAGPTITVKNIGVEIAKATGEWESSARRIIRETNSTESVASTSFSTPRKERPRNSPLAIWTTLISLW